MRPGLVLLVLVAACSGTATTDSGWTELQPMEIARSEHPAVVHDEEIVVVGGLVESGFAGAAVTASVEAYDPESGVWRRLPDLPAPRHHVMAAVAEGRLFVIGGFSEDGFDSVDTVWELVDGIWETRTPLPEPVGAGAATTLDGSVYVVGGVPGAGLFRYDPHEDIWEALRDPFLPREHLAAVSFQGELWAIGGRWQAEVYANTEIYDPQSGLWREGPRMSEPRSGFGATVIDGSILVAGGEVFAPTRALSSVERHHADADEWELGEPLPEGLHGNPLTVLEDIVYLPGGSSQAGGVDNAGTLYSLELD